MELILCSLSRQQRRRESTSEEKDLVWEKRNIRVKRYTTKRKREYIIGERYGLEERTMFEEIYKWLHSQRAEICPWWKKVFQREDTALDYRHGGGENSLSGHQTGLLLCMWSISELFFPLHILSFCNFWSAVVQNRIVNNGEGKQRSGKTELQSCESKIKMAKDEFMAMMTNCCLEIPKLAS